MVKVVIIDDQDLIRESLELILGSNDDIEIVGTASNGRDGIQLILRENPQIALVDIRMPGVDGIECIKIINEQKPEVSMVALTTFDDDEYIYDAIRYGAKGYLLKSIKSDELAEAVHIVAKGGSLMTPAITSKVLNFFSDMAQGDYRVMKEPEQLDTLQPNERNIIKLIGQGYSNKEISGELHLSDGTVRNYISSILQKLDLRDRTQIAIFAVQNRLTVAK